MSINIMNTMQYTNSQNYDRMRHLITETNLQGNLIKDYVWSDQMMPVAQIDAVIPAKPVPKKACPRERGGGGGSAGKNPVNYTYNYLSFSCTSVVIPAQAGIQSIEVITYLYTDHLMTNRLATSQSKTIIWRWEGEAFGNIPAQELSGVSVNLRFPGQYYDSETNLHYNWHRYYDPALGRYITSDPIGIVGGMNTYLYARANAIRYIDPNGLLGVYGVTEFDATIIVGSSLVGGGYIGTDGAGKINSVSQTAGLEVGLDFEIGLYLGDRPPKNVSPDTMEIDIDIGWYNISIGFYPGGGWFGVGAGPGGPGVTVTPGGGVDLPPGSNTGTPANSGASGMGALDPVSDSVLDRFCRDNPSESMCEARCP